MAKVTPGPLVGQISGRIGASVFSHNAGGVYVRNGTIPTTSSSADALAAKSRLQSASQGWAGLTAAQRLAWEEWAKANPIRDRLGQTRILSGIAAYNMLTTRLLQAGDSVASAPPTTETPAPLTSLSAAADIGVGADTTLTFAPTPLGANERLRIRAVKLQSAAINYVTNQLRVISIEAAATATGVDYQTALEAKFGAMQVDDVIHFFCDVQDSVTGLVSQALRARVTVVST